MKAHAAALLVTLCVSLGSSFVPALRNNDKPLARCTHCGLHPRQTEGAAITGSHPLHVLAAAPAPAPISGDIQYEVYFSPRGGCTDALVKEIDNACSELLVQAYSFTSTPIAEAISAARDRGLTVQVVLDESNRTATRSASAALLERGVATWYDGKHAIAHNKVAVIDGSVVATGSFNFTRAAEKSNAENLLIVRDPALATRYRDNFLKHLEHSERATNF